MGNTFAQTPLELNSTNITQAPFNCPTSATTCYLWHNGITSIAANTFINHTNLTQLYLQDNSITSVEVDDFNGLDWLTYLDIKDNSITTIEDNSFDDLPNLENLYLWGNQITQVNVLTFTWLTSLEHLDISNNLLTSIQDTDFNQITSLILLYLGGNQISSIQPNSFSQLSLLESLDLSANQIETLHIDTFNGLSHLNTLYLYANQLSQISNRLFSPLSSLVYLDLSDNLFTTISKNNLPNLPLLTELSLSFNQIVSIEKNSFSGFPSLETLYLDSNKITTIEEWYFNGLGSLNILYLGLNQITSLASNSFSGLSSLEKLYLENNNIISLETNDFNGLDSLSELYLHNNDIVTIEDSTFNWLTSLTSLYVFDNQLVSIDTLDMSNLANLTTVSFLSNCNHNGWRWEINYFPGMYAQTDSDNCVPVANNNSYNASTFITNLESKGYITDGNNYYVWIKSINLNTYQSGDKSVGYTTEYANTILADIVMQSVNLNNYEEEYYQYPVEIQYEEWTTITSNGQPYNGIIHAPKLFNIISAPSITKPVTLMKFWSFTDRLDFSQPVTIRMPALDNDIWDSIDIYSSDGNIYTDANLVWNFEDTVTVIDKDGVPYIEFTVDHATYFATTLPVGQGWGPFTGDFTINNDDASTLSDAVTLNISTTPAADQMRFSNDGVSWSTREAYATSKAWTLTAGYATKTVYAQFDTDGDNIFEAEVNDTILYTDGSNPTCPPWSYCGDVTLRIDPLTAQCVYGTSVHLGITGFSYSAQSLSTWFLNTFGDAEWYCQDTEWDADRALSIQMLTDLINQTNTSYSIPRANVLISNYQAIESNGDCTPDLIAQTNSPIDIVKQLFGKDSALTEICTITTTGVNIAIDIPAAQNIWAYSGTIQISYDGTLGNSQMD